MRERSIGRLTVYRRALLELEEQQTHVFSHQLAKLTGVTPAQLRRDLMPVGYEGSPNRGYEVTGLLASLSAYLDGPGSHNVALIGVGNLGRALLTYFTARTPNLTVVAAFDTDVDKVDRIVSGCRVHHLDRLEAICAEAEIHVGILAVPKDHAQEVARRMIQADFTGILNFAPLPLELPPHIYVENVDLTMSLEKVNCFAQQKIRSRQPIKEA